MADPIRIMMRQTAAATTSTVDVPGDFSYAHSIMAQISSVSFTGGTAPTVTVTLFHSHDGTNWASLSSAVGPVSAGGTGIFTPVPTTFGHFIRLSWTCGGTPTNVSFSVLVEGKP